MENTASTTGATGATAVAAPEIVDGLNDLLQLNHDAIGAYDIAVEKLEDRDHASQIAGFKLDHERHIRELTKAIQGMGGAPVNEPHSTGPLKEAMQALGSLAGDRGTLLAWRTNEFQVRTKYDRYAARAVHWPSDVKRMVDEQALDEERHYRWVADALEAMGVGSGEGLETDLTNRVRERMSSVSSRMNRATSRMKDRVESTTDYVRDADGEMLLGEIEDQVRARPLRTLALMFGVGFVIGRILR